MHTVHIPSEPLHVRRQGEGEGEPVLCLHASGSTSNQWRPLFDAMAARAGWLVGRLAPAQMMAPDFHGHGKSPAWPVHAPSRLDIDARAVARLLPAGGAHLVGHSYGGAIALWLAQQQPERVLSLTLYEPVAFNLLPDTPGDAGRAEVHSIGVVLGALLANGRVAAAARVFAEYWSGADGWTTMSTSQQAAVVERMPTVVKHFESLAVAPWNPASLARDDLPVLLLEGEHTRAPTRRIVDALEQALPQSRRCRIAGAGHMGPVTHAAVVTREIAAHLGDALWHHRTRAHPTHHLQTHDLVAA